MDETIFCWRIHHERLLEILMEPLENRIEYIQTCKPVGEREIRLRLLQPVQGTLPEPVVAAGWRFRHALKTCRGPSFSSYSCLCSRAETALRDVIWEYKWAIDKLHSEECLDCPWDENTIFPSKEATV